MSSYRAHFGPYGPACTRAGHARAFSDRRHLSGKLRFWNLHVFHQNISLSSDTTAFEFVNGFSGPVELVLGADFQGLNWPPAATEEIESIAETYLNSGTDENAFSVFGSEGSFIMSPRRLQIRNSVEGVNGIPPEGVTCD